jgi:rubrerythrin
MHKKCLMPLSIVMASISLGGGDCASAAERLKPEVRQDLKAAMENEAFAVLRYRTFADQARKEGKLELAELLERTLQAENAHFGALEKAYTPDRPTLLNISEAIVGEYNESKTLYAKMAERAEAAGDKETAKLFRDISEDEAKFHQDFIASMSKATKPAGK